MSHKVLIDNLQHEILYNHLVTGFEIIETHLSWVMLTGPYAYKIKKPFNLGFNDFTTLEKRKHYCELELSLNKVLAPDLYLNLVAISGTELNPILHDPITDDIPNVIEYAIKTNQFDQNNLLSHLNKNNKLNCAILDSIAKQCADFHSKTPACDPHQVCGSLEAIFDPVQDNFDTLKKSIILEPILIQWTQAEYESLKPLLIQRKKKEFIRACHGDLHLGNIVMIEDTPVIFDCIEFNEFFRWIDVISDIAFLAMDLEETNHPLLSNYFVNRYCEYTGDYEGLLLLVFYKAYRALIRAKIAAFNGDHPKLHRLIELALSYTCDKQATLSITFGPSGAGKSHYTACLPNSIRLRSDVIRKQLMGLPSHQSATEEQKIALYSKEATLKLYHYLRDTAQLLLTHNISVVVDATCLKKWQRALFQTLAQQLNIPFTILEFEFHPDLLKNHILQRQMQEDHSSDATLSVLEQQLKTMESLSESEKSATKKIKLED